MNLSDLPSAPVINGHALRREAYCALNSARIQADRSGGTSEVGTELRKFFLELAKLCPKTEPKKEPTK